MIRIVPLGALCALLTFAGVQAAVPSIVGTWYEEAHYGGSEIISILQINPDGTYTSTHRQCLKRGHVDDRDDGRWEYDGKTLRLATRNVDGTADGYVNEYRTDSIDDRIWVYVGVAGPGFRHFGPVRFRDVRVTKDSKVPDCGLMS